jgi:hypothetical protein
MGRALDSCRRTADYIRAIERENSKLRKELAKLKGEKKPTMKKPTLPASAALLLLVASLAHAQTPPVQVGPSLAVDFHSGFNVTCASPELVPQWPLVYGARCNQEPPVVLVPFIAAVLVRLTPTEVSGVPTGPAVIRRVPRASVWITNSPLLCAPEPAPCQSVRVAALPGLQQIDVALETADAQQSEWVAVGAAEGRFLVAQPTSGRVRP